MAVVISCHIFVSISLQDNCFRCVHGYVAILYPQSIAGGAVVGGTAGAGASGGTGALPGAMAGASVVTPFALKAGRTVYGVTSAITSYNASYDLVRGGAYKTLIDMGVDEQVAREISNDTAVKQSLVEAGEGLLNVVTLFTSVAGKATVKSILGEALKSYGWNILTEYTVTMDIYVNCLRPQEEILSRKTEKKLLRQSR